MKVNSSYTWDKAQSEELECWVNLKDKLNSKTYFYEKSNYWKKILEKSSVNLNEQDLYPILEIGCGPSGIFIVLNQSMVSTNYHVLDPLLNQYKKIVSYLDGLKGFSTCLEDAEISQNYYRTIFAINCIDHCKEIEEFCTRLEEFTHPEGTVYLAVNTHKRKTTARIWRYFQSLLEPLHPHHYTQKEYEKLLAQFFEIKKVIDIEDEVIEVNNNTRDLNPNSSHTFWKVCKKKIRGCIELLSLQNLIFSLLDFFGLPAHDFNNSGDSLYRHKLFVLMRKN